MKRTLNHLQSTTFDAINRAGAKAYKRTPEETLRAMLFVGNVGNTFYTKEQQNIEERVSTLKSLLPMLSDNFIAQTIVEARNEGLFRTIPILALVLWRQYAKDKELWKIIFLSTIKTPNDLEDFLRITESLDLGLGRAVKTSIHKYLNQLPVFHIIKYRPRVELAIRLSRYPVDKPGSYSALAYSLDIDKEKLKELKSKYIQIKAAEKLKKHSAKGNVDKALKWAKKGNLPADLIISQLGSQNDPKVWREVMHQMGTMQLLKYLNKLTAILGEEEVVAYAKERFSLENIRKAKIFPYRFFIAWHNATSQAIKLLLTGVLEAYSKDPTLWGDWKDMGKHIAICPDVSASMTWHGNPKPSEVAGFFSSVMAKGLGIKKVLAWDTGLYPMNTNSLSLLELYNKIANFNGGGTNMGAPIQYLIDNGAKNDLVIIITDNESWAHARPVGKIWKQYKKINPAAKLIVLGVEGYRTKNVSTKECEDLDVYHVDGWSESVFKFIKLVAKGEI